MLLRYILPKKSRVSKEKIHSDVLSDTLNIPPGNLSRLSSRVRTCMRVLLVLLVAVFTGPMSIAGDLSPKDLVARLYQAHRSKPDPPRRRPYLAVISTPRS
jgi:hypothetical protein